MGPSRSLVALSRKLSKSKTIIARWSSQWGWVNRVQAYDDYMEAREQEARAQAIEEESRRWAERARQEREEEWELARQLRDKARQMLAMPLVRQKKTTNPDGSEITVIEPTSWRLRDVVAFLELSVELAQDSSGMKDDTAADEDVAIAVVKMDMEDL